MLKQIFQKRLLSSSRLLWQETVKTSGQSLKIQSSCPAGSVLTLNIKKAGKDPVALEDAEYPTWLWTVLDKEAQAEALSKDPLALRKKKLRQANRKNIKQNNFLKQI
ncbi:hypothetical protein Kpol_1035p25 [Vanderwaltozyma polyspora DSM 70294]|uniref:Large ribosomal subunit protein mL54 n=1 Tax=Vanderwaltozyma polyspora (strain ATCC 22028 / DSM 70294 / BCRC 21397 / CBS 2163 / NBRC 10782 / NRRL Y-8283 / UCD 57-17) TaxID=436907 RepID=A7TKJ0_VANPO|nr:uncharacterized protein Kpol_1035p25 [Vanderwaltozyma polyspora DSM 70294]EDO17212.1 hypothetical protein Kpol_1035p25 [Vanderwaltozyma polyspora DSM 70294]